MGAKHEGSVKDCFENMAELSAQSRPKALSASRAAMSKPIALVNAAWSVVADVKLGEGFHAIAQKAKVGNLSAEDLAKVNEAIGCQQQLDAALVEYDKLELRHKLDGICRILKFHVGSIHLLMLCLPRATFYLGRTMPSSQKNILVV